MLVLQRDKQRLAVNFEAVSLYLFGFQIWMRYDSGRAEPQAFGHCGGLCVVVAPLLVQFSLCFLYLTFAFLVAKALFKGKFPEI